MRLVPVIDVLGPEVLKLLPCCGRIHGALAARMTLPLLKGQSQQMIGYVVVARRVELHAEIGQSV